MLWMTIREQSQMAGGIDAPPHANGRWKGGVRSDEEIALLELSEQRP